MTETLFYDFRLEPETELSREEKLARIAHHFGIIMETLGLDLDDPSLRRTPQRVAKMYVDEVFKGLDANNFPTVTLFDVEQTPNSSKVICVKCEFCTFCEHHFTPTYGTASIAYIPQGKVIGLSKIPEIVRFYSQQPQLQERLTLQIAESIKSVTGSDHVAVSLSAQHFCMIARDPGCRNSHVVTHQLFGDFHNDALARQTFFDYLR